MFAQRIVNIIPTGEVPQTALNQARIAAISV